MTKNKIYHKLTFNAHFDDICKKKTNALSRVIPCMNITKQCTLLNTFFTPQFNHCPSLVKNYKINRLYETCLRMIITGRYLLLSNYWKRIVLSLYIQRIFVFLQQKCLKLLRSCTEDS